MSGEGLGGDGEGISYGRDRRRLADASGGRRGKRTYRTCGTLTLIPTSFLVLFWRLRLIAAWTPQVCGQARPERTQVYTGGGVQGRHQRARPLVPGRLGVAKTKELAGLDFDQMWRR